MKIDFLEIGNFRKLQSCRIDFDKEKTLLVGVNNSGKTSAMVALRKFLTAPKTITLRDISIGSWNEISQIGLAWENNTEPQCELNSLLPVMDLWLDVPLNQIHHIVHIIPNADWEGGSVGVRLRFEIENIDRLKTEFIEARLAAKKIEKDASTEPKPIIEPRDLVQFLDKSLSKYLALNAYSIDPNLLVEPDTKGRACLQTLSEDSLRIDASPFQKLINIREIPAMRDFSATGSGSTSSSEDESKSDRLIRTLSDHVRSYYDQHIDQAEEMNVDDVAAFSALQQAEKAFDKRLKTGFSSVFDELSDLGIPGINNPSLAVNAKFKTLDGLGHSAAVQYSVAEAEEGQEQRYLPEGYAGLGYQNLIAMVFLLMRFRLDWIEPKVARIPESGIAPLQLIMIEEPEAHLHAQVQQVFIKKAYSVLRNHEDLGESNEYSTQLLVSTHSSHVAHEVEHENLRYFRRLSPESKGLSPTSTVIDLSNIYGANKNTLRFVKRYIKVTDCDLFFADGAIFVEGQAERILVPHFIRTQFESLNKRYISLIDIGGSNAKRFEPLLVALGLTSLVITDLDAGLTTTATNKNGKNITRTRKAKPMKGGDQVTTNPTLKKWHPRLSLIDELISLDDAGHQAVIDDGYELYIAFQKEIEDNNGAGRLIPRTFEDALVYANLETLKDISGSSTTNKISKLVNEKLSGDELESQLFSVIEKAEKAAFAIDCLIETEDGSPLNTPPYIEKGLSWLQEKLEEITTSIDRVGGSDNG